MALLALCLIATTWQAPERLPALHHPKPYEAVAAANFAEQFRAHREHWMPCPAHLIEWLLDSWGYWVDSQAIVHRPHRDRAGKLLSPIYGAQRP